MMVRVYRIRLFRKERPVCIWRFGGIDEEGILAIGSSGNIERRRRQFITVSYRLNNTGILHLF